MDVGMPGTHGGQERVLAFLDLDLSELVSHHVGAGIRSSVRTQGLLTTESSLASGF